MAETKKIDEKLLSGLKYKTTEVREVVDKESGKKKKKHFPLERALTADDVLSWKDNGESVTIVTKDGAKYLVQKKAEKKTDDKKDGK